MCSQNKQKCIDPRQKTVIRKALKTNTSFLKGTNTKNGYFCTSLESIYLQMIQHLHIRNYALIEDLEINFPNGLTIITGETGAGKSILLGALNLIMGGRADSKSLYNEDQKCVIEARFEISSYELEAFFEQHDLDYEQELIIRREITPKGKSRAFVNDTPSNLKVLQQLSAALIDLHQQFDSLDIHQNSFQLRLLDALANNNKLLKSYQQNFKTYTAQKQQLSTLKNQSAEAQRELEFLKFQLDELLNANLDAEEQSQIETELSSLSHAEDTKRATSTAYQVLSESEHAILSQLQSLNQSLHEASQVDPTVAQLQERLMGLMAEIEDLGNDFVQHAEATEYDPQRIAELQERIDLIYRLQKKHFVSDIQELLDIQEDLSSKVNAFENIDEEIAALESALKQSELELSKQAAQLSTKRQKVAGPFAKNIAKALANLAMPASQLIVDFKKSDSFNATGLDDIEFLFSANKGSAPKAIKQVASGGELSRLTLVTKSLVASAMALPTLIFDEIDAGVSGDVALKMGQILQELSRHHQLIVITHSPQVAARGDEHLFVYKKEQAGRTATKLRVLNKDERIHAIATMLSQNPPSEAALDNARELLDSE